MPFCIQSDSGFGNRLADHWADIACHVTAEPSLSVTKRRSGARGTRRHDGIGDLPSDADLLMLVCC